MSEVSKKSANLYHYDPLDRLVSTHSIQRFYNNTRIATEIQGDRKTCFFEHEAIPLAELQPGNAVTLLNTDPQNTVLHSIKNNLIHHQVYSPYGHHPAQSGLLSLLAFNGERRDSVTGHYLLGQGYRAYNPVLMRFHVPDKFSPFRKGGLNAYAYCENDPINSADPSGEAKLLFIARRIFNQSNVSDALSRIKKSLGSVKKAKTIAASPPKKPAPPSPSRTQLANNPIVNTSAPRELRPRTLPSTPARRTMGANKAPIPQNQKAISPIYNSAAPDDWNVQLIPGSPQPAVSSSAIRPVHNYAAPGDWNVHLIPDSMQPYVRLIRTGL
jgi:RHS repeat-associated protein